MSHNATGANDNWRHAALPEIEGVTVAGAKYRRRLTMLVDVGTENDDSIGGLGTVWFAPEVEDGTDTRQEQRRNGQKKKEENKTTA
jgi:hypothetical protein